MRRLTTDVLASDRNLAHGVAAVGTSFKNSMQTAGSGARGHAMDHQFAVGQTVVIETFPLRPGRAGEFKVVRLLPERQYRLKSLTNDHERVAQEDDLRALTTR
ncbi:MAG: hypothetical protein AB7O60_16035 [Variibacter sp.]